MMYVRRKGGLLTVIHRRTGLGFTAWRQGAISFLAPIGDGVPMQIVFGDWWQAHPEAKRRN